MTNPEEHILEERGGIEWSAFLYIADELPDEERDEFERQLLEDQGSREAVAGSVEVAQAIHAAFSTNDAEHGRGTVSAVRNRRAAPHYLGIGAAVVGLAALVLIVLNAYLEPPSDVTESIAKNGPSVPSAHADIPDEKLARTWFAMKQELSAVDEDDAGTEGEMNGDSVFESDDMEDEATELSAPDWLLVAVSTATEAEQDSSGGEG